MTEQNTGWRDISTAPKDGTVVLVREKDGCVYSANFCPVEESWKLADQDGMRWNDDLELVAHWKALPPPPGEEVEDWYALGVKDGRDGCLVELDALQARCDMLESAAREACEQLKSLAYASHKATGRPLSKRPRTKMLQRPEKVRDNLLAVRKALRSVVDGGE